MIQILIEPNHMNMTKKLRKYFNQLLRLEKLEEREARKFKLINNSNFKLLKIVMKIYIRYSKLVIFTRKLIPF